MTDHTEAEREKFEAEAKRREWWGITPYPMLRHGDSYDNAFMAVAWDVWKTVSATQVSAPAVVSQQLTTEAAGAAPPAQQWLPIADAPKDGSLVLLCTDGGIVFVGKFRKHLFLWVDDEGRERFRTVKWFQPLPPAPQHQDGGAVASECQRCGGTMAPGVAIGQTATGSPDELGGDVVTMSPGGPGKLIDCLKCSGCGHSVSA